MSEDYDSFYKRMVEKYPREFRNVYCGVSINAGWEHIIENLVAQARHHIKWRRDMRMRDHLQNRAVKRGVEAVTKLVCKGRTPSMFDETRIEEIMEGGLIEPTPLVKHIEIHQIKEKFGGLRFYYDGGDDQVYGMVQMAEVWAGHTCETCGERGKLRHGGWVRTLCDKHEAEYQQRIKDRNYE